MSTQMTTVGISISEPDVSEMGRLGIGLLHVQDAMVETARFLLNKGFKLAYGGDLNYQGTFNFSELLFQLGRTYGGIEGRIYNYSAFPYYTRITERRKAELVNIAKIIKVNPSIQYERWTNLSYDEVSVEDQQYLKWLLESKDPEATKILAYSLTVMRKQMTKEIQCRIVIGGRSTGYAGDLPGIWEETLLCLEDRVPVYVDGRFGGAAREVVNVLNQCAPAEIYGLGHRITALHRAQWQTLMPGVISLNGNGEFPDISNLFKLL